jgi:hypothetical protein
MRPFEIEAWVLRVADDVTQKRTVEDSLVELKSVWPPPESAARQIAAHANAARGAPILWIIGLDEKKGVCGASPNELADWFPAVRSQFNQVHPDLHDLNVRIGDQTVVALFFATERAPFVVKNPRYGSDGGGSVEWEVPWREGRSTRTAKREDLIRLLAPLSTLPEAECLDCRLSVYDEKNQAAEAGWDWHVTGKLYVIPSGAETLVFPFHRCSLTATLGDGSSIRSWTKLRLSPPRLFFGPKPTRMTSTIDSLTVDASSSEVILTGPGQVTFSASTREPFAAEVIDMNVSVVFTLNAVGTVRPLILSMDLQPAAADKNSKAKWAFSAFSR